MRKLKAFAVKLVKRHLLNTGSRANEFLQFKLSEMKMRARSRYRPARFAMIGCGRQGASIASAIRSVPKFQLTALLDRNAQAASKIATRHPAARVFESADEFWSNAHDWDALIIATTANSHIPVAMEAINAGVKAIFMEKPVANCLQQANQLIAQAQSRGCSIAVNHTRRYLPAYTGLKRLLKRNVIGKPRAVHFITGRAGMSMIGSHLFDAAFFLFDGNLTRLQAVLDQENDPTFRGDEFQDPCGRCDAELDNGIRITMDLSSDLLTRQLFFVVVGEHGRIEVDERREVLRVIGASGNTLESPFPFRNALSLGVANGLMALIDSQSTSCTAEDGRNALEAVVACHRSNEMKSWVSLPLDDGTVAKTFAFA